MHHLLTFLTNNPIFGFVSAAASATTTNAIKEGIIPDGVEEITLYIASLLGIAIAALTLVGMIRKEQKIYQENHKKIK